MSSRCNIIDNDGNFSSRDAFEAALPCKGSTIRDGINYWIVAVFGGQSTGKSTLLNGIFGTNFETMNEEHGRSQTTRGIWLEESPRCRSLYAMDVEGTDGQERFDCQTFERRTSLFALAVCDVFVINMWTAEVGRFNAANLSLLRTIFEMRLDLFPSFKKGEKTCILFVLRDHVSGTLEKHAEVMRNSLQKVWDNVTQAHVEKSRQLSDVFSLHFMSLPHYHLQRDAFDAGVVQLSKLLTPTDPSTSILPLESAKEGVPLSELHTYMSNVWNTIYLNKDLDIPSQKELLARHRCTEISEVWWKQSAEKIDSWRYTVCEERRVIPEIGVLVEELARDATTHLEEEAKLYSPVIVQRSARELQDKIVQACKVVVEEQIQIVVHHHKETFMHRTQSAMDAALLKGNSVPMCWEEIRRETARYSEEIEEIIQERVKERVLDNYTHERAVGILKEVVTESVSNRLRTIAQDLHKRMHDAFENDLHHNKDGSNRFFHSVTLLTTTAKRSQGVGFEYLDTVCVNRLEFPELDQSVRLVRNGSLINYTDSMKASSFLERHPQLFIVGLAECQRAHELYLQQVEFTIQLLERNIEMGANRIPWYFWLLLVYFARNDLWYILTSPMILITLGVVLYVFLSAQIKEWILRTLSDPPIWFQYMELGLEQHAPHLSTWIREKRGQVAVMNAPSS